MSIADQMDKIELSNLTPKKQNRIMRNINRELVPVKLNQLKLDGVEKYYNPSTGHYLCTIETS